MHHYHTNTRPIKRSRNIDMLHGSIGRKLILFALPLAFTGILQQLFNAADVAVVGRFVGKNAMAAVGSNTSIISLLLNLFVGISLGANVVISKFIGQQERQGVRRAVHTSILVSVISGLFLTVFGELLTRPMLRWMGVPEEIFGMSETYLRIYLLGMPVILLYNFESAIFRSKGDTKTPLLCLIVSGGANVALNLILVLVVHLDVAGVAIATVTSNLIGAGMLLISLLRNVISDQIRFPAFIVVIASFVTIVELVLKAYIPSLYDALGLYIPLIVVNCIIMGRAEAYASKASPMLAAFDGIGMGLGFTIALTLIGSFRELLGNGTWLGYRVMPSVYTPIGIFVKAPGAFIVLGAIIAVLNGFKIKNNSAKKVEGCDGNCCGCSKNSCSDRKEEQKANA